MSTDAPGEQLERPFFGYERDRRFAWALRPFGVRLDLDGVRIADNELTATYGLLRVRTPLANITEASITGPYQWFKAVGPRLSAADHGLTFGTTDRHGVCLLFDEPIEAAFGPWRHPGLTVTVADVEGLVAAIEARADRSATTTGQADLRQGRPA